LCRKQRQLSPRPRSCARLARNIPANRQDTDEPPGGEIRRPREGRRPTAQSALPLVLPVADRLWLSCLSISDRSSALAGTISCDDGLSATAEAGTPSGADLGMRSR